MAYKIVLDAGHEGGSAGFDPGAVNGKYKEAVANLAIAKKVGAKLQAKGYKVKYTRTGDKELTLKERCQISNKYDADLFISIHLNSSSNSSANGCETLRYPKVGALTKELANNIQTELVGATGFRNRGVKERGDLYVLKHTIASAVIVECCFISNSAECKKAFNNSWQEKIANAIVKGVMKTLKY